MRWNAQSAVAKYVFVKMEKSNHTMFQTPVGLIEVVDINVQHQILHRTNGKIDYEMALENYSVGCWGSTGRSA